MRYGTLFILVAISVWLAWVDVALGGTASVTDSDVVYIASPGEVNDVTVAMTDFGTPGVYEITDAGAAVIAGTGCVAVDADTVSCTGPAATRDNIIVRAGDFDDQVSLASLCSACEPGTGAFELIAVFGGSGNDTLTSTSAGFFGHTLSGGAGDDVLLGAVESDDLIGGSGADLIDGGPTAGPNDDFFGTDRAIYTDHATAVTVRLDGVANDGSVGEGDNVLQNIDVVIGGAGNDRLVGNLRANELEGRAGRDTLIGSGGADQLSGGRGADTIWAGRGNDAAEGEIGDDWIAGGPGADQLYGGDLHGSEGLFEGIVPDRLGDDTVSGGPGADLVLGQGGNDRILGRDGNDVLIAQRGADRLYGGRGADNLVACRDRKVDRLFGGLGSDVARLNRNDIAQAVEDVAACGT